MKPLLALVVRALLVVMDVLAAIGLYGSRPYCWVVARAMTLEYRGADAGAPAPGVDGRRE